MDRVGGVAARHRAAVRCRRGGGGCFWLHGRREPHDHRGGRSHLHRRSGDGHGHWRKLRGHRIEHRNGRDEGDHRDGRDPGGSEISAPQDAAFGDGLWRAGWHGERRQRRTGRDGSPARSLRCIGRDVSHRHRMPARAVGIIFYRQSHYRTLNMPELPLIARAHLHARSVAFRTVTTADTYLDLLDRSATLAAALLGDADDLEETRVALLVSPGFEYAAAQW